MAPKRSNRKIKRKPVKLAAITLAITTPTYPSCILLHLPTELLIKILTYLPVADLFSVRWTCRTLGDIITNTAYLQYIIRAYINGVEDSLPPDFPYSKRLELLRRREQSWSALQFDLFAEYDPNMSRLENSILQDGYLVYGQLLENPRRYRYTDLYSAARNEEVHWVHITIDNSPLPPLSDVTFAIDHNLVVGFSKQRLGDDEAVRVQLTFFEFTTGSFHPLSSTPTVSLPPIYGRPYAFVSAEVLGDHILVFLRNDGKTSALYLVSWKAGTVVLINGLDPAHATTLWSGNFKALVTDDNVFVLMKDGGNRLEVCKLDITSPGPCLQKICSLELPPLMPWVSVHLYRIFAEWVPTSKNYARSRSSRASPAHFYSSTVGTITLFLNYTIPRGFYGATYGLPYGYALIIDVEALLDTIRTGVHNVPWADWGPSSTHLFQRGLLHLDPAGPSWITEFSPLMLRQYYPRRTRYTQSMPENSSSSSRTGPRVFSSTDVSDKLWGEYRVVTSLPYRDIVVYDINLSHVRTILADREWVVGMAVTPVAEGGSVRITVYHLVSALVF